MVRQKGLRAAGRENNQRTAQDHLSDRQPLFIHIAMSNSIATISGMSAQISAKASPCGALSLLSLDLTRGCRVQ
ncbi:hypothetical protein AGR4B_Cc60036 [Agrobacterium tumefaciens str. CFBP 5621]|nr:hypothetical protein AGR4B_Cc60036 [Agrobacterium tumefaciens str. CFBP 5621]